MKSLRTLLKLARRDLETLRRALAELIQRQSLIEQRMRAHTQAIVSEQQAALKDYESQRAYGGFAVWAVEARRALEAEQATIALEIDNLRALVAEAHVEARKFERLIEMEAVREKVAAEKRENAEMDEFATLRAARSKAVGNGQ